MNQQKFLRYQIFLEKQKNFFRRKNMYEYKFSDKQSDEISDKTAKIDDLFKKFDDIDSKFDFKQEQTSDGKLSLARKEFERPTDEQIKESAENSLFDFKDSSLKKIENDFQTGSKKIDDNLSVLGDTKQKQQESLKKAYADVKESASNDAIKRGLARSSIIVNKLAKYDSALLDEYSKIEKSYNDEVVKLNNQKSQLEVQRQNALDGFDIAYAVKLSEKISSLNTELDKKQSEIIEYNNKMEKLEQEYLQDQQKLTDNKNEAIRDDNQKLLDYYTKYGEKYVEKLKQEQKFGLAKEYLDSLPKQEALNFLETNTKFKSNFPTYYTKLYNYTYGRAD